MKAGSKPMTKSGLLLALAGGCDLKRSACKKVVDKLAEIGSAQVTGLGKFTLPGLCRIKTRVKPAPKAGEREMFGKVVTVKARPARTIVKAYPVAAVKKHI